MEMMYDKMEMTIVNAKNFAWKHDHFHGMPISEFMFLTAGMNRSNALYEAVLNAYNIGFRRGYNRAKKEMADKPAAR